MFGKNDSKEKMKKEVRELFEKTQLLSENANSFETKRQYERDLILIRAIWVLLGGKV